MVDHSLERMIWYVSKLIVAVAVKTTMLYEVWRRSKKRFTEKDIERRRRSTYRYLMKEYDWYP